MNFTMENLSELEFVLTIIGSNDKSATVAAGGLKTETERAGFEPAVPAKGTPVFETGSISHSDTSPVFFLQRPI